MIKYDNDGFMTGAPAPIEKWAELFPEMPMGRIIDQGSAPPGVLIINNFLSGDLCRSIVGECEKLKGEVSALYGADDLDTEEVDGIRECEIIRAHEMTTDITSITEAAFQQVAGYYRTKFEWFESPQILRYRKDGHFLSHSDSDAWDESSCKWTRVLDRDVSTLLYINEDYEGGEIAFMNFGIELKPMSGMLIAFPSDARYIHKAKDVTAGVRYAIVSWAASFGTARVQPAPPKDAVRL